MKRERAPTDPVDPSADPASPSAQVNNRAQKRHRSTRAEKQDRVALIADLMARNKYQRYVTCTELSRRWGLTYGTVEQYACEASRQLRLPPEQREEERARIATILAGLSQQAATQRNRMTGLAEPYQAAKILLEYARLVGIEPEPPEDKQTPTRLEIVLRNEPEPEPTEDQ